MTQITEIEQAIASENTVNSEGHGFITGRGLARLLGLGVTRFTATQMASKTAEILTQHGLDTATIAATGAVVVSKPAAKNTTLISGFC
jgi:hypothetical protein